PPRSLEAVRRPRLHARPRDRPLDRDDDDRVPPRRRGRRRAAPREHGRLDAPARGDGGRADVHVHAGHVGGRPGGRPVPLRGAFEDVRTRRPDVNLDVFIEALPPRVALDYGVRAEDSGFRAAWFPEITFGDAFGPATAVATRTKRLELATGVVGIWSRSPV